jgi:hypothetical protein
MDYSTEVENIMAAGRGEMNGVQITAAHSCGIIMGTASVIPHLAVNLVGLVGDVAKAVVHRAANTGIEVGRSYKGAFNKAQLRFHPQTTIQLAGLIKGSTQQELAVKEICALINVSEKVFLGRLKLACSSELPKVDPFAPGLTTA